MKRSRLSTSPAGFTLIEMMLAAGCTIAMGVAVFGFLNAGMYLTAKNLSLNMTSDQMRSALDRVEQILQQGDNNPTLIDTNGANVAAGSSAGVKLDRFVGGPYVVTTTATGLAAGITSVVLTRSTNSAASPALPSAGDVIRFDGASTAIRPIVSTATVGSIDGSLHQAVTVNFTAPLSAAVSMSSTATMTAKLVRNVAFIVMTNGANRELRYYPSLETTTNLNDPTKYTVITTLIATTQAADATPFSFITLGTETFIDFALRVRSSEYDKRLATRQVDEFNTFSRVESFLRPKVNP